jgi:hypothetical protein
MGRVGFKTQMVLCIQVRMKTTNVQGMDGSLWRLGRFILGIGYETGLMARGF